MAKSKIIDSESLICLKSSILTEIENADSQTIVYEDELKQEKQHRRNDDTITRLENQRHNWIMRRDILHQCLCKIQAYTKEIEI